MPTIKAFRWRVIAHTEQGASHVRNNLPNQDAVQPFVLSGGRPPVILTVADGHGSPKSFRSDIGSRFAVESASRLCSAFLQSIGSASPSAIKNSAEQQLPREIIATWKQKVEQHFKENPFSQAESDVLSPQKYLMAYGATLLIAAISDTFLLYFQLGDGEILVVSDSGEVSRPIPKDESLIANETTSLCMDNPLPAFRFRFQYFPEIPPAIVLLSTDGYPNSFRSDEGFFKVGTDLLEILRTDGGDTVERDLPEWLREASSGGSGDDVTLGIIYRLEPPLGQSAGMSAGTISPDGSIERPDAPSRATETPEPAAPGSDIPATVPPPTAKTPEPSDGVSEGAQADPIAGRSQGESLQAQPGRGSGIPSPSPAPDESGGDREGVAPTESAIESSCESPSEEDEEERSPTDQHPSRGRLARILMSPVTLLGSVLMSPVSLFKRKD